MTITFKHKGNFSNTERFLNHAQRLNAMRILEKYGPIGVSALSSATPKDTGLTASSWNYFTSVDKFGCSISWTNSNFENGAPVAILIQYGHGTQYGGYIQGIDYINPAMKPIFEKIVQDLYEEVSKL